MMTAAAAAFVRQRNDEVVAVGRQRPSGSRQVESEAPPDHVVTRCSWRTLRLRSILEQDHHQDEKPHDRRQNMMLMIMRRRRQPPLRQKGRQGMHHYFVLSHDNGVVPCAATTVAMYIFDER
jgi:hypothetical protein